MATKVIIVPKGTTKFSTGIKELTEIGELPRICMHCGFTWHAHFGDNCPEYTKTVQIKTKTAKSTCVKFQPQVEKELLRLGIKHALLAEMKLQGLLKSRLSHALECHSTQLLIYTAFRWAKARRPINGHHEYLHWNSILNKARN